MSGLYCFDTSSLVAAWGERYPPENFPSVWERLEHLISDGRMILSDEVHRETKPQTEDLYNWLKERSRDDIVIPLTEEIQLAQRDLIRKHPFLLKGIKNRNSADSWTIATAQVKGAIVVTEED